MIVLAVIKDEQVEGQRRAKGKMIRKRVGIAIDNYNIMVAIQTGDNPWTGQKWYQRFSQMARCFDEFGLTAEEVIAGVVPVLNSQFGMNGEGLSTLAEVDEFFSVSKRTSDSTGHLELSMKIKANLGDLGEAAEEDNDAPKKRGRKKGTGGDVILTEMA